jgi:branched-chain amino acid transport system permease protein
MIFLPEHFRELGEARLLLFGLALVIVMILRPEGLISNWRWAAELAGRQGPGDRPLDSGEGAK